MNTRQYFFIHVYYNSDELYKILFDWLLPFYKKNASGEHAFEFIYFSDLVRGSHLKVLVLFKSNLQKAYFDTVFIKDLEQFLKENPSVHVPTTVKSFFAEYPNNSIHQFQFDEKAYFSESEIVNERIITSLAKYMPYIMAYRENYDVDTILTTSLVISNAIISSFATNDFEKEDFYAWTYKEKIPTADYYSKKDKDIRNQKQKEIKELKEGLRRNYIEQKEYIGLLIDSFSDLTNYTEDLEWLFDFSQELIGLSEMLKTEKIALSENFKYQSNTRTAFEDQEKWAVIQSIISHIYNSLGCSDVLTYNILFSLKEYYKTKNIHAEKME